MTLNMQLVAILVLASSAQVREQNSEESNNLYNPYDVSDSRIYDRTKRSTSPMSMGQNIYRCTNTSVHIVDWQIINHNDPFSFLQNAYQRTLQVNIPLVIAQMSLHHDVSTFKIDRQRDAIGFKYTSSKCVNTYSNGGRENVVQNVTGYLIKRVHDPQTTLMEHAVNIMKDASWTEVIVVHQSASGYDFQFLLDKLFSNDMKVAIFGMPLTKEFINETFPYYFGEATPSICVVCFSGCIEKLQMLNTVDSYNRVRTRFLFIIPSSDIAQMTLIEDIRGIIIPMINQATLPCKDSTAASFDLISFSTLNNQFITVCLDTASLLLNNNQAIDLFPRFNNGLNGRMLRITTEIVFWDLSVFDEFEGMDISRGTNLIVEHDLQAMFLEVAQYVIIEPDDGEWGAFRGGRWTGMVGMLHRDEADVMIAPTAVDPGRESAADFIQPYYWEDTVLLVKLLDDSGTNFVLLFGVFSYEIIIALALVLTLVIFLMFMVEKYNPYNTILKPEHKLNFSTVALDFYSILFGQDVQPIPQSLSGRIVFSSWWFFRLFLIASYTCNLMSYLAVSQEALPFRSVEEMLSLADFKWGVTEGTIWSTWLKTSADDRLQRVWKGIEIFNKTDFEVLSADNSVHVAKVKRGKYAYFVDKTFAEVQIRSDCSLTLYMEGFLNMQYAVGVQTDSPYKTLFTDSMLAMNERGIVKAWRDKWWPKLGACHLAKIKAAAKPLSMSVMLLAFYMICIGVGVAVLSLLVEIISFKAKIVYSRK